MPGPVLDPAATAPFGLVTGRESGLASPNELSMALDWPRAGLRQRHRQADRLWDRRALELPWVSEHQERKRMVGPVSCLYLMLFPLRFCVFC